MRTSLLDVKDLLRRKHSYLQSSLLPCSIIYRRGNHSPATVNVWHVASVKRSCSTQSHLQPTWANAVRVLQTQGAPPFIGPRSPRLCWGAPSCCFIHRACKKDPKSLFIIESSLLHHEDILLAEEKGWSYSNLVIAKGTIAWPLSSPPICYEFNK